MRCLVSLMPDQVELIVTGAVAKRAMLVEEFLKQHNECWPGPNRFISPTNFLTETVKCSCGAQLEVTILVKLVSQGYQPKKAA